MNLVLEHLVVVVVQDEVSAKTDVPSGPVEEGTVVISSVVVTHKGKMAAMATEVEQKSTKIPVLAGL